VDGVQLLDHGCGGVFEEQPSPAQVDGDFFRKIAAGDGGGHFGDVADLCRQVRGHEVDVVGQVLPGAGDAGHAGLPAELALGADFARDARDFGGEGVELVHHRMDEVRLL